MTQVFSVEPKGSIPEIRRLLNQADSAVRQDRRRKAVFLLTRAIITLMKGGLSDERMGLV